MFKGTQPSHSELPSGEAEQMNKCSESVDKTLKELRRFATELGHWPSQKEWDQHAKSVGVLTWMGLYYHLRRNWEQLRKEMGFPPHTKKWTAEECLEWLRRASEELGPSFTRGAYREWRTGIRRMAQKARYASSFCRDHPR